MKNQINIIRALILIFIVSIILLIVKDTYFSPTHAHRAFGIIQIRNFLLSYGKWSIAILLVIYIVKPLFVVTPISVLAVVSGIIYGPIYGTTYAMIGSFLSATVGYFNARFLGQGFVDKLLKGKKAKIEGDIERNGFKIIVFLRLAFIFPFDALSYAAGLTKMKYRHFILGTLVGVLPEMFAYNYLGTNIDNLFSKKALTAILLIVSFVIGAFILKSQEKIKN
jgi:uncharacterized membrane protein YdjX (TVP38/TMEM64 family)